MNSALSERRKPKSFLPVVSVCLGLVIWAVFGVAGALREAGRRFEMSMRLGQAIIARNHSEAQRVLRAGADPNAADIDDSLILAMAESDSKMVALLLKHGANPSKSLLHVRMGDAVSALKLLSMGADPNARVGTSGFTPLGWRCILADEEVARLLLKRGGDIAICDDDGMTILQRMDYAAGRHPERSLEYARVRELIWNVQRSKGN